MIKIQVVEDDARARHVLIAYIYISLSLFHLAFCVQKQKREPKGSIRRHSLMNRSFSNPDLIKILILFVFGFLFAFESVLETDAMKVHPMASKRNITTRDAMYSSSSSSSLPEGNSLKRLRRLPHVFGKVLELPFRSDADVAVEETSDCFRFVAGAEGSGAFSGAVRAHVVEIHPGVTKIVVRSGGGRGGEEVVELLLKELEVDVWRFRLPSGTRPELVTAVFADGELIVTVPKSRELAAGEGLGGFGRLVLVQ
ncbi:uncharacterized protein LOC127800671 [Diospyros lotus]|uniref:uncharacterized protein LOC127800671 n=1 Tax=Diospyros lotus TaxID=55363 RepID=UPI002255F9BB|nr:uncharacterized protein LOC127800671 [Diospyros lotus]